MHLTRQFETAVCGGSNLKAPMKLDFLRSLCAQERHAWPEVVLCRVEGETLPVCCLSEAAAGDPFARIGIVTAPSEALTALLRTAPVRARVTALCDSAGEPCDGGAPDVWGFLAEYRCGDPLSGAVRAAIDGAAARGCASPEALTARAEYLLEQAVPEPIILRVFAEMFSLPEYPELVPDPPVRYVQADGFGALTRCLAYRLSGMHLRLVGSKGCGKNTLIQTVDWLLNVPQYRMQGNAELDKLDLLGGPTIENGTMRYRLSDMLRYLAAGADVVLDEGNTIKPECADVLHSLTDAARQIQVPGYGLVQMHPHSAFTITMNEDYAGTNFMNEATIDRFTPIHIAEPESLREVLGTGWGAHRGFALSAAETDAMLAAAEKALTRERAIEQQLHVSGPRAARLDAGELQGLAERYAGLTFTETYITPGGGRLPPAFAERAKALHHRLDKLLRQQRERSASQRTGALSQRELWKIPLDAKDVFRRKAPPSKRETAFYLLIDRSGSMGAGIGDGTSKLFTALATAAVLEEALKGIAYTKIVAFDGGTNAVEHCVIKDFDQKEIGSRCIDAMEQIAAGNGNKDGYSIRAAALDLAKRTERRKILMVLSDGLPSGYFSEAEAIDDVRTAVQAARRRGLLVIPIIYTARTDENVDAYRRMYEKSMIFADSVGMLGEFERLLMKLVR